MAGSELRALEYVDPDTGDLTNAMEAVTRIRKEKRDGQQPPQYFIQKPNDRRPQHWRVVMWYATKDFEELLIPVAQINLALRRRSKRL